MTTITNSHGSLGASWVQYSNYSFSSLNWNLNNQTGGVLYSFWFFFIWLLLWKFFKKTFYPPLKFTPLLRATFSRGYILILASTYVYFRYYLFHLGRYYFPRTYCCCRFLGIKCAALESNRASHSNWILNFNQSHFITASFIQVFLYLLTMSYFHVCQDIVLFKITCDLNIPSSSKSASLYRS